MEVLHLSCQSDRYFYVWAEDSERGSDDAPNTDHPFASDVWALWDLFEETAPGWLLEHAQDRTATLMLPTSAGEPVASPGLMREESGAGTNEPDSLQPWRVPALTLPGSVAVGWLRENWLDVRGVEYGSEWPVWRRCAELAADLVDAGQLVPTLEEDFRDDDSFCALWRPIPAGRAALAELEKLERAMPPSIRADASFADAEASNPETFRPPSKREILARGLTSLVDGLARTRLQAIELYHDPPSNSEAVKAQREWLSALRRDEARVDADRDALDQLKHQLDDWTRQVRQAQQRRVRLHFRLQPPVTPDGTGEMVPVDSPWRLEFLLQSVEEPSLVVEAETVWSAADRAREVLDTRLDRPQERLLEELGRAQTIFPDLDRALDAREPKSLELTSDAAFEFVEEYADLLDQAGFSIQIPDWWDQPGHRLSARMSGGNSGDGELGLEAVCRFDWEVALGDESLDRDQLEELASLKQPLVRHRGEWVTLDSDDVEAALELLENASGEMKAGEALRTRLGLEDTDLPVTGVDFDGWLGELFETAGDMQFEPTPTPENFDGQLRPYQSRGLGWIRYLEELGLGGCLADDMGLGKTIQVLARLAEERLDADQPPGPTLAVVPLSVVGNWRHEAERFVPELDVRIYHGPDRPSSDKAAEVLSEADLVVTTYGVVRSDIEMLETIRWHRVVLDEAQKVKNSSADRTKAVRRLPADRRLALTGTPVENRLTELWSIMQFLNPGMLGSEKQFREKIAIPVESGLTAETGVLRRLTAPFILRRLKTDEQIIDDLPEKTEIKEYCTLTEEQATLYQAAVDETLARIDEAEGIDRRGAILKLMTQLKQICNHPAHFLEEPEARLEERSGKLDRLEELAADIDDVGDKALIFTQYTAMGQHIRRHLQHRLGRRVLYLHGQTDQSARDDMVRRFQDPDGPPFFLLSLRAGGTGLTLTAANHVIHYDRWWNPAVEDQATDRAFRIGQTDDVQVRKLICEGTFEERIDAMIDRKKELAERVLSEGEAFLTELSTDELRDIVRLSSEELS